MADADPLERVLDALYDAMLDDRLWPKTAGLIDEACRTEGSILGVGDSRKMNGILFTAICLRGQRFPEWEQEYLHEHYETDEHLPRFRTLPEGRISGTRDLFSEEELKTSFVYNDGMRRCRNQNALNVRLNGPGQSQILWTIGDPVGTNGWSAEQVALVKRLLPHVRQFVRVRHALAAAQGIDGPFEPVFENLDAGVFQLDRQGRVVGTNQRGQSILDRQEGLSDRGGELQTSSAQQKAELQELLAATMPRWGEQATSGSLRLEDPTSATPTVLHTIPISRGRGGFRSPGIAAVMLAIRPQHDTQVDAEKIAAVFGLTPTEVGITKKLAEGKTVTEIARRSERSENTVRWHMKHIFSKVGVTRQVDLARVMIGLGNTPAAKTEGETRLRSERVGNQQNGSDDTEPHAERRGKQKGRT